MRFDYRHIYSEQRDFKLTAIMWHTHTAMGISTAWLLVPFVPWQGSTFLAVLMVFCVISAMVPELDAVESKIKHVKVLGIKPRVPVSKAINQQYGHRGLLHSLRGWVGWTVMILPLGALRGGLPVASLSLGYTSHLTGDVCTRSGILLFYPRRRSYHLLPRQFRVVTGSEYEELFFAMFVLGAVGMLLELLVI